MTLPYSRLSDPEWTPYQRRYWGRRLPGLRERLARERREPKPAPIVAPQPERSVTFADILAACAAYADVPVKDLTTRSRFKHIVIPRQAAIYIACQHRILSLPQIGRALGHVDHTAASHGRDRVRTDLTAGGEVFGDIVKHVEKVLRLG